MSEQRDLYLINGRLDGVLEQAELEELDDILEASAEARATEAEFLGLVEMLESQVELDPPEGLTQKILQQATLPPRKPLFSFDRLFSSFQPASAGLAFAAGLLLTVAFYEIGAVPGPATDTRHLVGTMVASQENPGFERSDRLVFDQPGLSGSVSLMRAENITKLDFDFDSDKKVAVKVRFAEAGLRFGGMSHAVASGKPAEESFAVADGTFRVDNQGQQAFTVFLTDEIGAGDWSRGVQIEIFAAEAILFSGVFKSDSQQ
ncbi:MAG: hypothetical protein V2I48_17720 [Xanthomonadales bacterium]|jgi:hypothetical protein|nr:hypothetical protein [Xanthomonadales bacterium]